MCTWCGRTFRAAGDRRLCDDACADQERRAWAYLDDHDIDLNEALGVALERCLGQLRPSLDQRRTP